MKSPESGAIEQLPIFIKEASIQLQNNRVGRLDNLTAATHPDHYAHELIINTQADVARGKIEDAKATVDFWLDNTTEEGRVPHMLADVSGIRRKLIDRRVVGAEKNENGEWPTKLSGMPVLSISAEIVAENMDDTQRAAWSAEIFPKLTAIKEWQYKERDLDNDGLITQLHPDETFFRHGEANEKVLHDLHTQGEEYRWTHLADRFANNVIVRKLARSFRQTKGTGKAFGGKDSSYDPEQYMSLQTAGRVWDVYHKAFGGFKIKDVAANALLVADNESYENIAEWAGSEIPDQIKTKIAQTEGNFRKFWDEENQKFASIDGEGNSLAEQTGAEQFLAIVGRTAMSEVQVEKVIESIERTGDKNFPIPTGEQADKIHRGAMHPMINALVYFALSSTDERESRIKQRIGLSIYRAYVNSGVYGENGEGISKFSEAYNSQTGESVGADYWGPTAAAAVAVSWDMLDRR